MKIEEFNELLKKHDWFYQYSDDARAYNKGQRELKTIINQSDKSKDHQALYKAWYDHHFNNLGNKDSKPKIRYIHCGESDCVFITLTDNQFNDAVNLHGCYEITAEQYEKLKVEYGN